MAPIFCYSCRLKYLTTVDRYWWSVVAAAGGFQIGLQSTVAAFEEVGIGLNCCILLEQSYCDLHKR